jgi:hydroxymethylglutaryl-CoA lyase
MLHITECPRDAMQGIKEPIATASKIAYLSKLMQVGFPVIDAGSFVSAAAIPQMADTAEVFDAIMEVKTESEILAIVANQRGAEDAAAHERVSILGYPFSVSETFQLRNTNATIDASFDRIKAILEITAKKNKQLRVYLSMAFGNPYGDVWNEQLVSEMALKMNNLGIRSLALADTIGNSTPELISSLFSTIRKALPAETELSLHLHSRPEAVFEKMDAAWDAGCRHIDSALLGFGGCPMAGDTLTGNMATETLLAWCEKRGVEHGINLEILSEARALAGEIFHSAAQ